MMKRISLLFLSLLSLGLLFSSQSRGATVFGGNVDIYPLGNAAELRLGLTPNVPVNSGGWVSLSVSVDSNFILHPTSMNVGEFDSWYAIGESEVFGPDYINSHASFATNGNFASWGQLQIQSGQSFLLGIWTDLGGTNPSGFLHDQIPGPGDYFSWIRMKYTSGIGFTVLDTATSISDPIIAGTTNTIPETSSSIMALAAGSMLALRRRR